MHPTRTTTEQRLTNPCSLLTRQTDRGNIHQIRTENYLLVYIIDKEKTPQIDKDGVVKISAQTKSAIHFVYDISILNWEYNTPLRYILVRINKIRDRKMYFMLIVFKNV